MRLPFDHYMYNTENNKQIYKQNYMNEDLILSELHTNLRA
jgi:hypothetical protein